MGMVVHVDNSDFFRKLVKTFLGGFGHESFGFSRGEDALDKIMANEVDYVITGLELADMSGEDFIKKLLLYSDTVPIIVITAKDDGAQNAHLLDLGVKAIIKKSGDWKVELKQQLANIIAEE